MGVCLYYGVVKMIKLDCPACKNPLIGPEEFAGKKARCPVCRTRVPAPEIKSEPMPVETEAAAPVVESPVDDLLKEARSAKAAENRVKAAKRKSAPEPVEDAPKAKKRRRLTGAVIGFSAGIAAVLIAIIFTAVYISNVTRESRINHLISQTEMQLNTAVRAHSEANAHLESAREAMGRNDYGNAAVAYNRAYDSFRSAGERLAELSSSMEQSALRYPTLRGNPQWAGRRERVESLAGEVRTALAGEELTRGREAGDMVLFEGRWVTPEEYSRLHAESMERQGMVLYEGEWITYDEAQRRRGFVLHEGRWITQEQYEAIRAQEEARQAAIEERRRRDAEDARRREEERRLRLDRFPPAAETWVVDDFATPGTWSRVDWANPVAVDYVQRNNRDVLQLQVGGGREDKAAIEINIGADFSSRRTLTINIENTGQQQAAVAIAFQTNDFFESRPQAIRPGSNQLRFDLTAGDFKSRQSNWAHSARLGGVDHVARLIILIYGGPDQTYYIHNIYATGGPQ